MTISNEINGGRGVMISDNDFHDLEIRCSIHLSYGSATFVSIPAPGFLPSRINARRNPADRPAPRYVPIGELDG